MFAVLQKAVILEINKIYMKMKITFLIAACISVAVASSAQVRYESSDPFNTYSFGVGVGYSTIYGALKQSDPEPVLLLHLAKHFGSFFTVDAELQHGTIKSTEPANHWTTGLSETNQYNALNVNGRVTMGKFMGAPTNTFSRLLSNLYVGAGFGIVNNDITNITDKFKTTDTKTINSDIVTSGMTVVVPVNIGLNIYTKKLFGFGGSQFNINYQQNYAFNDDINGYSFPSTTTNHKYNAIYSVLSVGLSFYLGHIDEYK